MTNYPDNWIPEPIPVLAALVTAEGVVACTLAGEIWGAGAGEIEALQKGRENAWNQNRDVDFALRTRPATEEAVAAVRNGQVEGVVFEPRLDLFATSAEVQAAEAKIEQLQRKWRSWLETRKKDWEQQHGPFRSALLAEMAQAYASGTDDGVVVISESVPKWRAARASAKECNFLVGVAYRNAVDEDGVSPNFRATIDQIYKDVEGRWPRSSYFINLSEDPHRAADEVAICLGNRTYIESLNPPPRHRLRKIGEAIWGSEWISPLARELGISIRTANRYAAGDSKLPDDIFDRLAPRVAQAKLEIQARLEVLNRL